MQQLNVRKTIYCTVSISRRYCQLLSFAYREPNLHYIKSRKKHNEPNKEIQRQKLYQYIKDLQMAHQTISKAVGNREISKIREKNPFLSLSPAFT